MKIKYNKTKVAKDKISINSIHTIVISNIPQAQKLAKRSEN